MESGLGFRIPGFKFSLLRKPAREDTGDKAKPKVHFRFLSLDVVVKEDVTYESREAS